MIFVILIPTSQGRQSHHSLDSRLGTVVTKTLGLHILKCPRNQSLPNIGLLYQRVCVVHCVCDQIACIVVSPCQLNHASGVFRSELLGSSLTWSFGSRECAYASSGLETPQPTTHDPQPTTKECDSIAAQNAQEGNQEF